jgi:L-asparaginase II
MELVCKVTRGNLLESIHIVYAIVVDHSNNIIMEIGNGNHLTCIRSAFKPFQAATAVKAGAVDEAKFNEDELALMCASHSGEDVHVSTARSMMKKLGYELSYYECGNHPPYDITSRHAIIKHNREMQPLYNNCSGKHAGMLALAKKLNVEPSGYTIPEHPVQQMILENAKHYTSLSEIPISIDGCSAVAPFFALRTIAHLYQKLVDSDLEELNRVYTAMVNHPLIVGGTDRFDTDFIRVFNGKGITKVGGEAVRGVALKTEQYGPIGIALKVLDGSQRCLPQATLAVLKKLGLISDKEDELLSRWSDEKRYNHRNIYIGDRKIVWD